MKKSLTIALLSVALTQFAHARVEPYDEKSAIVAEPKVTIVHDEDKTLMIHQINGQVYGIKVIPKTGKPYYLVDNNGTGEFVRDSFDRMRVPQWVLISW